MDKIYDKCCGIDVHKKLIVACFRCGKKQEVREFGATTRELLELADWLKEGGCEMVAMESTASYWKPLYNILESSDLNAIVVNARHMKAVPGRKTDVKDAEWIADLLQHGLLQPSYIPDKDQRELRELVRYRKSLVGERTRELNRLQKMLEGANIKLSGTVSDTRTPRQPGVRKEMLAGLPQEVEEYVIPPEEKCSVCGGEMKVTGKRVVRTEVEFSPAKLIVKQIVQQVAKCVECGEKGSPNVKSHFQKAAVPVPPLSHSISTPFLVAQVMYQKFAMGLPLARQEKDWYRFGLVLSRSNMANWIIRCSQDWLEPVYWRIHEKLLECGLLHMDETRIRSGFSTRY